MKDAVLEKTGGLCWYCGEELIKLFNSSLDHVIPRAHGGDSSFRNIVPCCKPCNVLKSDKDLEEFRLLFFGESYIMRREENCMFYFEEEGLQ